MNGAAKVTFVASLTGTVTFTGTVSLIKKVNFLLAVTCSFNIVNK